MEFRQLSIPGAFEVQPQIFGDSRGFFYESFRKDKLSEVVGHPVDIVQTNTSLSQKGVLRGIHLAQVPRGQAKYVSVLVGSIVDYVVDLRIDSKTYGKWEAIELSSVKHNSVYVPEGCGHAFLSLEDNTLVNYLVTDVFRPEREFGIHPLDSDIGLEFPIDIDQLLISDKDLNAPSLEEVRTLNLLSTGAEIEKMYNTFGAGK